VLAQEYTNWEYIIVNNCSSDASLDIATCYASDPRVRIINTDVLLKPTANWNFSVRQMALTSQYCKIVHADDWIFAECLSRMVEVGEANPSVGIVSAYKLYGNRVTNDGIPHSTQMLKGAEPCRAFLMGTYNAFGTPTSILMRSQPIRQREALYAETGDIHIAADVQVCLELLKESDFGFVHQVLSFSRKHEESLTAKSFDFCAVLPEKLHLLRHYGRYYLNKDEYNQCWKAAMATYLRVLAGGLFTSPPRQFWEFHRAELAKFGYRLNFWVLLQNAGWEMARTLGHPWQWLMDARRRRKHKHAESVAPSSI
jgi:glycosyltransferase involved in cell wall biosynthesis